MHTPEAIKPQQKPQERAQPRPQEKAIVAHAESGKPHKPDGETARDENKRGERPGEH